jgi:hypothetical protein
MIYTIVLYGLAAVGLLTVLVIAFLSVLAFMDGGKM